MEMAWVAEVIEARMHNGHAAGIGLSEDGSALLSTVQTPTAILECRT